MRLRCEASNARRDAMRSGRLAEEIVGVPIPQKKGEPVVVSRGRASATGHDAGSAGEIERRGEAGWNGDRGECFGSERRCVRAAAGVGSGGATAWVDAAGARRGCCRGGRGAAHHGHGTCARDAESLGESRI